MEKDIKESTPRPVRLEKLADYQKGIVASRTIINKKTGTVTFFSFDKGQGLSEHVAPFGALVYIADGEALITISQKRYRLKKGETIILPAGAPHSLKAAKRFKMLLVMIKS